MSEVAASEPLVTIFGRLFENEFATLDGIAISQRAPDGRRYLDQSAALARMLGEVPADEPFQPEDAWVLQLHDALHLASDGPVTVVSGWSRHLRALLLEGLAPPASTSMMRKRGVHDLGDHLVGRDALAPATIDATLDAARSLAAEHGMAHLLLARTDGYVVVASPVATEAMAHWHNVEFAARVACLRVDELAAHATA